MDTAPPMDETAPGLTTHDLLQSLVQQTEPQLALETRVESGRADGETISAWQSELRAALWTVLGATPETHTNPALRVTESVPCDGYTRHRILIEGAHGGTIPAYALVPDGVGEPGSTTAGGPGVLCLHGHGASNAGKSLVAGTPADDAEAAYIESHGYDYAVRLTRHGYVTLAPDALGFGERAPDRTARYHAAMGLVAEYLGTSLVGLRLLDDARALTALAAWPGVDPTRLGVTGLSEGGKRTLFLAALDDRVRATAVSGYFTSLRLEARTWERFGGWDLCNHLFGLLRVCDLPDVAALIAPRPLLIQHGSEDRLYGEAEVRAGFETVRHAYAAVGAEDRCTLDVFQGGHVYQSDTVLAWFTHNLAA